MIAEHLARGELKLVAIRAGFGEGLVEAGKRDQKVVGLCADLTESTHMDAFAAKFPNRFIEVGVAEQNMVTVGSGLAAVGKVPFTSSYAVFSPGRNWEQIRTTIAINNQPVKIVGSHAGLYTGADGATHQMLEDLIIMRAMPNMVVLAPCDAVEATKATLAMAQDRQPNYLRVTREPTPVITTKDTPFEIGKAQIFRHGSHLSLVATGTMTYLAMIAAKQLEQDGISAEVVHVATIKPLDEETILMSAAKTGRVITIEEGQINGGLGSAVAEILGEHSPMPIKRIGMNDEFGQSGKPEELLNHYGLTAKNIAATAAKMLRGGK